MVFNRFTRENGTYSIDLRGKMVFNRFRREDSKDLSGKIDLCLCDVIENLPSRRSLCLLAPLPAVQFLKRDAIIEITCSSCSSVETPAL